MVIFRLPVVTVFPRANIAAINGGKKRKRNCWRRPRRDQAKDTRLLKVIVSLPATIAVVLG